MRGGDIPEFLRMDWGWLLAVAISLPIFEYIFAPHVHLGWIFLFGWSLLQAAWLRSHWATSVTVYILTGYALCFGARLVVGVSIYSFGWWCLTAAGIGFRVVSAYMFCGEIEEAFDDGVSAPPEMTRLFAVLVPAYYFQYKFREIYREDLLNAAAMPERA